MTLLYDESAFTPSIFLVTDFEATCLENNDFIQQEIIEFPIHIVRPNQPLNTKESFHSYVRPTIYPVLSNFCKDLTGITQKQVDDANEIKKVLESVHAWLYKNGFVKHESIESYQSSVNDFMSWPIKEKFPFIFVTDGPWDIRDFLFKECKEKSIPLPHYYKYWTNLRFAFNKFYGIYGNINVMLHHLGMSFEGSPHSGFDDALNIALILERMMKDGYKPIMNDSLLKSHSKQKRVVFKSGTNAPRYVGLFWVTSVIQVLSDYSKKELIKKGLYKILFSLDPIIKISVTYLKQKTRKFEASFSTTCNVEDKLSFLDEHLQEIILNDVKSYHGHCKDHMHPYSLDEASRKLFVWAKNQEFYGTTHVYNTNEGPSRAASCLLTFPDMYMKFMSQLEEKPVDRYIYRTSSISDYLNQNFGVFPMTWRQKNLIYRVLNIKNIKSEDSKENALKVLESILKHGGKLPPRIIERLPKISSKENKIDSVTTTVDTQTSTTSPTKQIFIQNVTSENALHEAESQIEV